MKRVVLGVLFVFCTISVFFAECKEETPTAKSTTTQKTPEKMAVLSGLTELDYMRAAALLIGLLTAAFSGTENWMKADMLFTLSGGVAVLLYPDAILKYEVSGTTDSVHVYLAQLSGCIVVSSVVLQYTVSKSSDSLLVFAFMLSKTISTMVLFIGSGLAHAKLFGAKQGLLPQHLSFYVLTNALMFLGHVINLFKLQSVGGGVAKPWTRLGYHLLVDSLLVIQACHLMLSHPEHLNYILSGGGGVKFQWDEIHAYLTSMVGAMGLLFAFYGLFVQCARSIEAQKMYIASRLVMYALLVVPIIIFHLREGSPAMSGLKTHLFVFGSMAVVIGNLLGGYYSKN